METLEEIIKKMYSEGSSQEEINKVIDEWDGPLEDFDFVADFDPNTEGELVQGDQRPLEDQIASFRKGYTDFINAEGDYAHLNTTPREHRIKWAQKTFPRPDYLEQNFDEDGNLDGYNFTKNAKEKELAKLQEFNKSYESDIKQDIEKDLNKIDALKQKRDILFKDMMDDNTYIQQVAVPETWDLIAPQANELVSTYQQKYNEAQSENERVNIQKELLEELNVLRNDALLKNPSYIGTRDNLFKLTNELIGEEHEDWLRSEEEFKIPWTDITLYKGISDYRFLEGLQKFGKQGTRALYGLEAMLENDVLKDLFTKSEELQTKINNGELTLEDEIEYDIVRSARENTKLGSKTGTVKEVLDIYNSRMEKEREEIGETLLDINELENDLTLFTKNELWDEDGMTFSDVAGIAGEQVLQLPLALLGYGIGATAQEMANNYIGNLYAIARREFNVPEGLPVKNEMLLKIIEEGKDQEGIAFGTGLLSGQLERLSAKQLTKTAKSVIENPVGSLLRGEFKKVLSRTAQSSEKMLIGGLTEALTEGSQGFISQTGEGYVTDFEGFEYDPKGLLEEASAGGVMGILIPGGINVAVQSNVEFNQAAMKLAATLGVDNKNTWLGSYAGMEEGFKALENKIQNDRRLNEQTKRDRILYLGQLRNLNIKISKDLNPDQRYKTLELLTRKLELKNRYQDSTMPEGVKEQIKGIDNQIAGIAEDAFMMKTVDIAMEEGDGLLKRENVFTAKTTKEADKIAEEQGLSMIDEDGNRTDGLYNKDKQTIIIDLQRAKEMGNITVARHEFLHRVLFNTLYKEVDGELVGTEVARGLELQLRKELNKIDPSIIKNPYLKKRLDLYKNDPKTVRAEEMLTIFSDALRLGAINLEESAVDQFNNYFRRLFQNLGWKKIKFKDGKSVINFIKDYNRSLDKGSFGIFGLKGSIIKGAEEGFEVVRGKDGIKRFKDDTNIKSTSFSKQADVDALAGTKQDGKYTTTKKQWDEGMADTAIISLYEDLQGLIKSKIPSSKPPGFSVEDFVSGTIEEMIPHIRNFNPEQNNSLSGWINSQLQNKIGNVFKKGEAITKDVFEADVAEAKGVIAEDIAETELPKPVKSKLRRALNINKKLIDDIKASVRKTFGTKLPPVKSKEFKQALQKAYRTELKKPIADFIGTRAEYKKFLEDNFEAIYSALSQDIINKRFRQFAEDTGKREKTAEGKKIFKKRIIDKKEFVDYFLGPEVGASTKGTRKDALAETLGELMAMDATMEVLKEPKVKTKRKEISKLQKQKPPKDVEIANVIGRDPNTLFSKSVQFSIQDLFKMSNNNPNFDLALAGQNKINSLLRHYNLNETIDLKQDVLTPEGREKIVNTFKKLVQLGPKGMWIGPRGGNVFTTSGKDYDISMSEFRKDGTKNPKYSKKKANALLTLREDINNMLNDPKTKFGKAIKGVDNFKISSYSTLLGNPEKAALKNKNGDIAEFNKKVSLIHKALWERIYDFVGKDKQNAAVVGTYLKLVANHTGHWHKMGAQIDGWSENPKGIRGTLYEYEHAMPATAAYLYLLDVALNQSDFKPAYDAVMDNYKLIALDKAENAKLGKAKLGRGMPKDWRLGFNSWWQRYFNPEVAAIDGGILPTSIIGLDGKSFAEKFQVNSAGQPTTIALEKSKTKAAQNNNNSLSKVDKLKGSFNNQMVLDKMSALDEQHKNNAISYSKSVNLSDEFNKILEGTTGIGAQKTYARVKAQVAGADKGKLNFFIAPSAEDFVGLLYPTLGRGKIGDAQMAWYKEHLLDPFGVAMENISNDRVSMIEDIRALKKDLKLVPADLRKKLPGEPFTKEHAVRVYIWDKQGMTVPGLSNSDLKTLIDFVNEDPNLITFANQLIAVNKGDLYHRPDGNWSIGTIDTDLMSGLNTTKRAKYLELWQNNVNEIFSEANLNKLQAAYGVGYRQALENILERMKTGVNRNYKRDTKTGKFIDWLTNSIGVIMFFNVRSALLQTISSVNFVNWTDNNLVSAGAAFANQPQFWTDFKTLWNSDFLKARRGGLQFNVNEADIAEMAAAREGSKTGQFLQWALKKGFLPTQWADSYAIATGGATFYRNRINTYIKQGMSQQAAEEQAFRDFRELAEEAQQSSRPDRISQEQAGPLGRIILAFANTPMQYSRLIKKAALDLKNGRGDWRTNISKLVYYGFVQNLIFNALQQALFALAFEEEPEWESKGKKAKREKAEQKRYFNVLNGMLDSVIRGTGIYGAIATVLKNTGLKLYQESAQKDPAYGDILIKEGLKLSPPLSSKYTRLRSPDNISKYNKKEMDTKGWTDPTNPAYLAIANVVSAITNVPIDRLVKKMNNVVNASNSNFEYWQRIAMILGWQDWEVGLKKDKKGNYKANKKKQKFGELDKAPF